MATKKRTFYAYKIINETVSNATSRLKSDLMQKLTSDVDNFGNRCKAIVDGSDTQDVLACFVPLDRTPTCVAGEMWRIAPSKDMPKIPQALFAQTTVRSDEVPDDPNVSPTDKSRLDYHFFMITDNILIATFLPTRASAFAKYLNELLAVYRGTYVYKFDPLIILPSDIKLSDIAAISFSDKPIMENGKVKRGKSKFGIFKTGISNLKNFFDDFGSTNELIDKKILSATMTLKLTQPKGMSDDDYRQELSAFLRPLAASDVEGVSFKLANGQEIKAMTIQAKYAYVFNDNDEQTKENVFNASAVMNEYLGRLMQS